MSRKQLKNMLKDFEDDNMAPLRAKIKGLSTATGEKEKQQLKALRLYETQLTAELRTLDIPNEYPTSDQVKKVFDNCVEVATSATKMLKESRSLLDMIVDTIKNIANFCIKIITFGKTPQFFNTTTKAVDSVQRDTKDLEQSLDKFMGNLEGNKKDPGPSAVAQ